MAKLVIKIDSKKIEFFDNIVLSTQINSIASSFSFDTFYDIQTYEFAKIETFRDDVLIFTGKVFSKTVPSGVSPEPFTYKCNSLTGVLEDCTLPLDAYPIQTANKTLLEIVNNICSYFDITVKIDSSATSDVNGFYTLQDQSPEKKAADIINDLCSQKNLILTHNSRGELIITKKIAGNNPKVPQHIKLNKSYNYRKFYAEYNVLGQQSATDDTTKQATSTFSTIDSTRSITKIQKDGDSSSTQENADSLKYNSYTANTLSIEFHDFFANTGDIFIINNVKTICNAMNYNYNSRGETCSLNLLNYKIYDR